MIDFLLDLFKEPAIRLAYQLGLSEENSFFGLETLLAVAGLVIGVILLTAYWVFFQVFTWSCFYKSDRAGT